MKILWLSRHQMTAAQLADLRGVLTRDFFTGASMAPVETMNLTLPAHSEAALDELVALARTHQLCDQWDAQDGGCIAAVLPAHIAAAVARDRLKSTRLACPVYVPVSVPAPAVDGETRGGGFL